MSGVSRAFLRKKKIEATVSMLLRDLKRCQLAVRDQDITEEQRAFWREHLLAINNRLVCCLGYSEMERRGLT